MDCGKRLRNLVLALAPALMPLVLLALAATRPQVPKPPPPARRLAVVRARFIQWHRLLARR